MKSKFTTRFTKLFIVLALMSTLLSACRIPRCVGFHPQNAPKPTGYVIVIKPGQPICYLPTYK